jgi:hypothetical protein
VVVPPHDLIAMDRFLKSKGTISFAVGYDQHFFGKIDQCRVFA